MQTNSEGPPEARRITPDCQPVFPCWIEYYNSFKEPHWGHFENDPRSHFPEFENDWIRWHPDQPTPPTQPPAPLAGGTAVQPSTAPAEVAAGCKEGRPVSPATAFSHPLGELIANVPLPSADAPTAPATGGREAELRAAIQATHDKWQIDWNRIYDQHKTASAYKYRPVLGYPSIVEYILTALTPLLDRREGEHEALKRSILDLTHPNMKLLLEEAAALRTLVAKQREALLAIYDPQTKGWGLNADNARIVEQVIALTPASIADELAALRSLVAKKDGAIERVRKTRDKYRKSGSGLHRDNMADHVKAIDELCALTPSAIADELAAKDALIAALREAEAARGEAEQTHHVLLPSERVQRLAQEFEQWPASEQQTKCSLLLVALVKELDVYEHTRPLTDHERELIDQGWKKIKAADDAARAQETRP